MVLEWKLKKYKTKWTVADGLNASIGQGYVLANPLQLAVMAARLASGRHLEPSLLSHQVHLDAPALPVASEHLAIVRDAMPDPPSRLSAAIPDSAAPRT